MSKRLSTSLPGERDRHETSSRRPRPAAAARVRDRIAAPSRAPPRRTRRSPGPLAIDVAKHVTEPVERESDDPDLAAAFCWRSGWVTLVLVEMRHQLLLPGHSRSWAVSPVPSAGAIDAPLRRRPPSLGVAVASCAADSVEACGLHRRDLRIVFLRLLRLVRRHHPVRFLGLRSACPAAVRFP